MIFFKEGHFLDEVKSVNEFCQIIRQDINFKGGKHWWFFPHEEIDEGVILFLRNQFLVILDQGEQSAERSISLQFPLRLRTWVNATIGIRIGHMSK